MSSSGAAVWDYEKPPRAGDNFQSASFRCLTPDNSQPVKAVLILLPALNTDGRDAVKKLGTYQKLVANHNLAVMGCFFTGSEDMDYTQARNGSGLALIEAVRSFSDQSGRRELFNAHFVLIGLSAGAQLAHSFACDRPERVVAFIADKGVYFNGRPLGATYDVPAMFHVGGQDTTPSPANSLKAFEAGRARGALWAYHTSPNEKHIAALPTAQRAFAAFLDSILTARIKENPIQPLERLRAFDGVFLDLNSGATVSGENRAAELNPSLSWLPNTTTANLLIPAKR
ncbi:MAG: hypothetical protein ACFCUX_06945 [Candidatus Methylacidiphilales bacterium]